MQKIEPFKPPLILSNRHVQTLYSTFLRKNIDIDFDIEIFTLEDGDFVECFWYEKPKRDDTLPIVVIFHGLEGSYRSPYIQGIMDKLYKNGYSPVLMHFRGCGNKQNLKARQYHSGDTGDAKEWIEHISKRYKNSQIFAIGYSLGGNMLLKLLGEMGKSGDIPLISMAVSVSAPMLLSNSVKEINRGFSKVYQWHLLKHLKNSLKKKYRSHPLESLIGLKEKDIDKISTIYEFDDIYTAKIHNFVTAKNYYNKSSSRQYLKYITTPTLIIHSLDDPFMTKEILPSKSEISNSVELEISSYGGHLGFIDGSFNKPKYWLEDKILDYFKRV